MTRSLKTGDKFLFALIAACLALGGGWYLFSEHIPGPLTANPGQANGSDNQASSANGPESLKVVCQTKDGFRRIDDLAANVEYTVETPGTGLGDDARGGANTITIKNRQVDVTSSNCHNQVCAQHDPIDQPGEQIVCLPHNLVVEIVQNESDASRIM